MGLHPTEKATRVRLLKRRSKRQDQRLSGVPTPARSHLAPDLRVWPVASALPTGSPVRGAESVWCRGGNSTYSRLVDALKNSRPVGRDARLRLLRDRRS